MKYIMRACESTNNWYDLEIEAGSAEEAKELAYQVKLPEPDSVNIIEFWVSEPEEIKE